MKHPAATLLDVANAARVSKATASRAISNPDKLSPKTLARVKKAMVELNYVSHGIARALATRSTRMIGAVIPTLENAIYAVSTHSLQKRLEAANYMVLVACHEFDLEAESRAIAAFLGRGVDGIVLVGTEHSEQTWELLDRSNIPYVQTWSVDRAHGRPCVGFDNHNAGRMIANYLLKLGHRKFGVIAGLTEGNDRAAARLAGIRDALKSVGIKLPGNRVVNRAYSIDEGRNGLASLLDNGQRPTAVLCGNDILAIGALQEAKQRGLNVPADLSITGFDDMPMAAVVTPALTTIHVPMAEVGLNAANYLLNQLCGGRDEFETELKVSIMIRDSTAKYNLDRTIK